jgi:hypothetical protein
MKHSHSSEANGHPAAQEITSCFLLIRRTELTNDTAKVSIKNHIYHYTTPHETVICDSDGMTSVKNLKKIYIYI